jgi:hypothetical protein
MTNTLISSGCKSPVSRSDSSASSLLAGQPVGQDKVGEAASEGGPEGDRPTRRSSVPTGCWLWVDGRLFTLPPDRDSFKLELEGRSESSGQVTSRVPITGRVAPPASDPPDSLRTGAARWDSRFMESHDRWVVKARINTRHLSWNEIWVVWKALGLGVLSNDVNLKRSAAFEYLNRHLLGLEAAAAGTWGDEQRAASDHAAAGSSHHRAREVEAEDEGLAGRGPRTRDLAEKDQNPAIEKAGRAEEEASEVRDKDQADKNKGTAKPEGGAP